MLKDAGAMRVSDDAVKEFRKHLEKRSFEIAQKSVRLSKHAKRKTVDSSDIRLAIN
jgi:histone H3/H4